MTAVLAAVGRTWAAGLAVVVLARGQIDVDRLRAVVPSDRARSAALEVPDATAMQPSFFAGELTRAIDQLFEQGDCHEISLPQQSHLFQSISPMEWFTEQTQ